LTDRAVVATLDGVPVIVEKRDIDIVVVHGALAGLAAGLVLGVATVLGTVILSQSPSLPFRFAASFVTGPVALQSDFPAGPAILLGGVIHFTLAALFGIVFVGLLAIGYQLSARAPLLIVYGAAFAFALWEVNFLAVVPTFFPFLVHQLDLSTQLWIGILAYVVIYGPLLGGYVAVVRPGVVDDWRAAGPPAGTFTAPTSTEAD